jgi:hypothetical protein
MRLRVLLTSHVSQWVIGPQQKPEMRIVFPTLEHEEEVAKRRMNYKSGSCFFISLQTNGFARGVVARCGGEFTFYSESTFDVIREVP